MERLRFPLALALLLALALALAACGEDEPDPSTVLDRALTRENLSGFGAGAGGPEGGTVAVQALGYEDRVLEEREVAVPDSVMSDIRGALGSDSGLRALVGDIEYEGSTDLNGQEVDHVSGTLEEQGLADALDDAGPGIGTLAGLKKGADLSESLAAADLDLYTGTGDGVIRRLDLTLALDDPDNALPPTRIRFSLTPDHSAGTLQ